MSPRVLSGLLFFGSAALYVYYTLWVLVTPFIDGGHVIQNLFPPREWALSLPITIGVFGMSAVGTFFGLVMIKTRKGKSN